MFESCAIEVAMPLSNDIRYFIIDYNDYNKVSKYLWHFNGAEVCTHIHTLAISLARFLTKRKYTDHINRNPLDNRRFNYRDATPQQNQWNKTKTKSVTHSKYKGVTWHSCNKKWQAYIYLNNKRIHIGSYELEVNAAIAYNQKALELFGMYANLNSI